MRQNRTATKLGALMQQRMSALGLQKQVDAARATGLSESTISRLLYDEDVDPDRETFEKLAKGLELDEDAARRAHRGDDVEVAVAVTAWEDPLAAEVNRMLDPLSPLTDDEREKVRDRVGAAIDSIRPAMRRSRRAG